MQEISYEVIYSSRRTLGISVLPDLSVIVRVPYRTSDSAITRLVSSRSAWILKHIENFAGSKTRKLLYTDGETHLFRGRELTLRIGYSAKPYCIFNDESISIGSPDPDDSSVVKRILNKGYFLKAHSLFNDTLLNILKECSSCGFVVSSLRIRTMKSRWGSCSGKGVICLNTELLKLPQTYLDYVIIHELCHLKHRNHGSAFYKLLSDLYPGWKAARKEMKKYAISYIT